MNEIPENEVQIAYDPTTGVVQGQALGRKVTVDELLEYAGFTPDQVTFDERDVYTQAWPTSMKLQKRDKDGNILDTSPVQVWNHLTRIRFTPKWDEIVSGSVRQELVEEVRAEKAGTADPEPLQRNQSGDPVMVELDIFDPHYQLLAWGPETGQNHDLKIISEKVRRAAHVLMERVLDTGVNVERWLLVVGNDLFHTDKAGPDGRHPTTTRGTPQDVDSRLAKAAGIVRRDLTAIILDLLQVAPVDVVVVPGNHDRERAWWMGEILEARFHGNENVEVDNRPILRKYYRYGNSLLGLSHGDNEKPKDMRDYMSQEARKDWAETVFREWHIGHYHHERLLDERGVVMRQLPSLAGTDAWHFNEGWVQAIRGARAFVWSRDEGIVHIAQHNVRLTDEEMEFTAPLLRGDRP